MPASLLIYGAGGHGRAVQALLHALPEWRVAAFLDAAPPPAGRATGGVPGGAPVPVLAESALPALLAQGVRAACIAVGDNRARLDIAARLLAAGCVLPPLVHPSAILAPDVVLEEGVVVLPRAVLGAGARIGRLALLNTGAIVEHDCVIGAGAHLAPGVVLPGGVTVGEGALLGAAVAARPGVRIGAWAMVGVGAAVVADVPEGAQVAGVPARPLGV